MLEKVWAIWITGFLLPSLPQDILLDLGLTERPTMVARTLDLYAQRPDLADQAQASGTRLIDVFDRLDRALLILGAPGAGKTTLLLTLARDLLIRAAQDPEQPIPVVLPLSSWAERRRPLTAWLVDALNEQYDVPRKIGQAWVDADHIAPLLDGLDEVAPEHRAACVDVINAFRQDHGFLPLVVCSRVAEFETIGTRLRLQGAIVVQPLTHMQVDSYLAQVGPPLATVHDALQEDPTLWELLDTPLMLIIVTLTYAGEPVGAFRASGSPEARHRDLFAAYVDRMFQRRGARTRYTRPQTERWLAWLAWQMTQHSQTIFYLEQMQPDWLPERRRWVLSQGVRLITGLMSWLVVGLSSGLVGGLVVGLNAGWEEGLAVALVCAIIFGLVGGLIGAGLAGYPREITTIETIYWSWSRFSSDLLLPLNRMLRGGWAYRGRVGLLSMLLILLGLGGPLGILIIVMVYKLGVAFMAGLSSGEITTKTIPNEGIYRSAWMALISGLGCGIIVGLIVWLGLWSLYNWAIVKTKVENPGLDALVFGLAIALLVGLTTGLRYGGRACLRHLVLRLILRHRGSAPWHYATFLDHAAERLFLRKVGSGYSFIHRRLQEYFAARYMDLDGTTDRKSG